MRQPQRQDELTPQELDGARARFLEKVMRSGGHWFWSGSMSTKGHHGWFRLATRFNAVPAHRAAWLLWRGDLPSPGLRIVCCRSDGYCLAPEHLTLWEADKHQLHAIRRAQESNLGRPNPYAKLDANAARAILRLYRSGWLHRQLAAKFGVSEALVGFVLTGRAWASATGLPRVPLTHGRTAAVASR